MRTTLTIDADVLAEFKRVAADTHRTLSGVIEDALREQLARRRALGATSGTDLPVVRRRRSPAGRRPLQQRRRAAAARPRSAAREAPLRCCCPDVNVLVAAHREAAPRHERRARGSSRRSVGTRPWLSACPSSRASIRVGTSPGCSLHRARTTRSSPSSATSPPTQGTIWVNPGRQHLVLLEELCRSADARGDLVSDAVIAALAIEAGATVVTYDRDFARFDGVRWRTPG